MENTTYGVIYARVSPTIKRTKEQGDFDDSIERQLDLSRRQAAMENVTIIKEYVDEYVSGADAGKMPKYQELLNDAQKPLVDRKFTRVYCRRVNRFGRSNVDMVNGEKVLRDNGISLKFVEGGIDTADVNGRMMFGLFSVLAERDREVLLENVTRGRVQAKTRGVKFGRKRKELPTDTIKKLKESGWSVYRIAKEFKVSPHTITLRLS
mgnify:CR=1 FL=1